MMKVTYRKSALKALMKAPKGVQKRTFSAFELIAVDDTETLDLTKMTGQKNAYRLRIGKYRAIYEVNGDITVLIFGSRGGAYKK